MTSPLAHGDETPTEPPSSNVKADATLTFPDQPTRDQQVRMFAANLAHQHSPSTMLDELFADADAIANWVNTGYAN